MLMIPFERTRKRGKTIGCEMPSSASNQPGAGMIHQPHRVGVRSEATGMDPRRMGGSSCSLLFGAWHK